MAALTADIHPIRFGTPGNASQPVNQGVKANAVVYRGSVAITRSGFVVAATTVQSTDLVWGLIDQAGPGTVDSGPGITGGTADGLITVDIATGSFWLNQGTGSDAIAQANVGATCYLMNENTVGLTSAGASRPTAGIIMGVAGTSAGNYAAVAPINSGMVAVKLGSSQSTGAPQ
jgi:hypothetical protein